MKRTRTMPAKARKKPEATPQPQVQFVGWVVAMRRMEMPARAPPPVVSQLDHCLINIRIERRMLPPPTESYARQTAETIATSNDATVAAPSSNFTGAKVSC